MAGDPLREGILAFARGHDPRSRRGRRYPLEGLLAMMVLAALHGEQSLRRMWGRQHWAEIRRPLGFLSIRHAPAYGALHRMLSTPPTARKTWSQSTVRNAAIYRIRRQGHSCVPDR